MDVKPRLKHESFSNRPERDARYYELQKTHENVSRYTDQEPIYANGQHYFGISYIVCYTPLIKQPTRAEVENDFGAVPDGIL